MKFHSRKWIKKTLFCSKKICYDESGLKFNNTYVQVFLDWDIFIVRDQRKHEIQPKFKVLISNTGNIKRTVRSARRHSFPSRSALKTTIQSNVLTQVALKRREQGKAMKLPLVLRLALLVSCLETVRGTPVDQKEKLFALVRIKLEVSFWFLFL